MKEFIKILLLTMIGFMIISFTMNLYFYYVIMDIPKINLEQDNGDSLTKKNSNNIQYEPNTDRKDIECEYGYNGKLIKCININSNVNKEEKIEDSNLNKYKDWDKYQSIEEIIDNSEYEEENNNFNEYIKKEGDLDNPLKY